MHGRGTAKESRAEAREWQMIKAIIGIGVALVWITFFALVKAAGMADRRLEEIQRLSAEREAGGVCGN